MRAREGEGLLHSEIRGRGDRSTETKSCRRSAEGERDQGKKEAENDVELQLQKKKEATQMSNPAVAAAVVPSTTGGASAPSTIASTLVAPRPSARKRSTANPSKIASDALDSLPSSSRRGSRDQPPRIREENASLPAENGDFLHGKDLSQSLPGGESRRETASLPWSSKKITKTIENASLSESLPARPKVLKVSLPTKPARNVSLRSAWHSLKRILSRRFLLYIAVAGLLTTFWNWKDAEPSVQTPSTASEVAELEELLSRTTKMLQVQLELVDMKIHKEVEGLKKDLEDKIEEQATTFETELRNMKAQTEDIQASLARLSETGFPTRQDVVELVNSVVDKRATEGNGEALSLDDVRAVARRIVELDLEKHAADGIGRVDYALATGGGKVVEHSEGFFLGRRSDWGFLVASLLPGPSRRHPWSNKIIEPSFGEPGQCLPLKGSKVYVDIALRTAIHPEAVTLEHVSKNVAYDISSAPKDFRVFGWLDSYKQGETVVEPMRQVLLGEFTYDIEKKNVQTFRVSKEAVGKLINMVKLDVISNYGSPSHTCIYRLRVHGFEPLAALPFMI